MKRIFLVITLLFILSCKSNSDIYEYFDLKSNTYSVIESSKKTKSVSYKSVSDEYINKFIYIEGTTLYDYDEYLGIENFYDLFIINNDTKLASCSSFEGKEAFLYGWIQFINAILGFEVINSSNFSFGVKTVSYTHLTLPTTPYV